VFHSTTVEKDTLEKGKDKEKSADPQPEEKLDLLAPKANKPTPPRQG
jgi:hypothetical protein